MPNDKLSRSLYYFAVFIIVFSFAAFTIDHYLGATYVKDGLAGKAYEYTKEEKYGQAAAEEKPKEELSPYIFSYYWLLVLAIAALVFASLPAKNELVLIPFDKKKKEVLSPLESYIKNSIKKGSSKEQIKLRLIEAGWKEDINKYLDKY